MVLLDLGLPDGDGEPCCSVLRGEQRRPLIVISARENDDPKMRLLDAGADDYLVKPFSMGELLARMRVGLRHRGHRLRPAVTRYEDEGLSIDLGPPRGAGQRRRAPHADRVQPVGAAGAQRRARW